jgi:hypothetical protein
MTDPNLTPKQALAAAARQLLDVYERSPEVWARVMYLLTPQDIATLREIATWDDPDAEAGGADGDA